MKYPGCWMRDAEMLCAGPPNVAGPMPPPDRLGRRARARAKAQAEGLNAKTVQDELITSNKLTLPAKRLERGDIRRAVEVALREWPNKSQREIAEQVGCNVAYVNRIKQELFTSKKLTLPATRTGKDGKSYPTTYATRTTRTATSATFNPVLDGGATVNTPGAGPGAHVSNSSRGPFQAWALDCDCAERAGTGAGAGTSAGTAARGRRVSAGASGFPSGESMNRRQIGPGADARRPRVGPSTVRATSHRHRIGKRMPCGTVRADDGHATAPEPGCRR